MMKKFIWINIILLMSGIWSGCAGTRNVDKQKNESKTTQNIEQESSIKSESETKINSTENKEIQTFVIERNDIKAVESVKQNSEGVSEKNNSEVSNRTEKTTEYYENGNKKSEREVSENLNKITAERDSWKNTAEAFKDESRNKSIQITSLTNSNVSLFHENKYLFDENKLLKQKSESLNKSTSNKTERSFTSFGWYVLAFFLGIVFLILIQYVWSKLKASQWYLKLFKNISNGLSSKT